MNLKIFPEHNYNAGYCNSRDNALEYLVHNTKPSASLSTVATAKKFIGSVDRQSFRLISSEAGEGVFCVFEGTLHDNFCKLTVSINRPFKILVSVLLVLLFILVIVQMITHPTWKNIGLIVPVSMLLLGVKLFLKYKFKSALQTGINGLNEIFIFKQ